MSQPSNTPKHKKKLVYNIFTQDFDYIERFNSDIVLTSQYGTTGQILLAPDPANPSSLIPFGPVILTDNDGNLVVGG